MNTIYLQIFEMAEDIRIMIIKQIWKMSEFYMYLLFLTLLATLYFFQSSEYIVGENKNVSFLFLFKLR